MQEVNIYNALVIKKSQLRLFCKRQLLNRPDLIGKVTGKLLIEAMIFIKGYSTAIEKDIRLPIIQKDVHQLLLHQGLQYIISQIDK